MKDIIVVEPRHVLNAGNVARTAIVINDYLRFGSEIKMEMIIRYYFDWNY